MKHTVLIERSQFVEFVGTWVLWLVIDWSISSLNALVACFIMSRISLNTCLFSWGWDEQIYGGMGTLKSSPLPPNLLPFVTDLQLCHWCTHTHTPNTVLTQILPLNSLQTHLHTHMWAQTYDILVTRFTYKLPNHGRDTHAPAYTNPHTVSSPYRRFVAHISALGASLML